MVTRLSEGKFTLQRLIHFPYSVELCMLRALYVIIVEWPAHLLID